MSNKKIFHCYFANISPFFTDCSVGLDARPQEALLCAKTQRQQQMFYLCESAASATNVLPVRKRSVSNKCFICAKAKRQRQMFYLRESEASATKRVATSRDQSLPINKGG
ncbi:hypothetical protein ACQKNB_03555 [Lysinibacillus xylanilyticus]|uniref:hypothetical protein n=1 Tax=Lysinibacillus xylanilyticus TaxID=582475 RepID=UPI003D047BAE